MHTQLVFKYYYAHNKYCCWSHEITAINAHQVCTTGAFILRVLNSCYFRNGAAISKLQQNSSSRIHLALCVWHSTVDWTLFGRNPQAHQPSRLPISKKPWWKGCDVLQALAIDYSFTVSWHSENKEHVNYFRCKPIQAWFCVLCSSLYVHCVAIIIV